MLRSSILAAALHITNELVGTFGQKLMGFIDKFNARNLVKLVVGFKANQGCSGPVILVKAKAGMS